MATILTGSPPSFNRNDVTGTVKALCTYTRGLQENLDFLLGNLRRDMEGAQTALSSQGESITSLRTALASAQESLSKLGSDYNALAARVTALENNKGA